MSGYTIHIAFWRAFNQTCAYFRLYVYKEGITDIEDDMFPQTITASQEEIGGIVEIYQLF